MVTLGYRYFCGCSKVKQDGFALMIQLGRVLGGWVSFGDIPTTFIQLAGVGSIQYKKNQICFSNQIFKIKIDVQ